MTRFLVVHIGMMIFIPLMAVVVSVLLRGVEGTAARGQPIALVPFVIFYSASGRCSRESASNSITSVKDSASENAGDLVQNFAENPLIGPSVSSAALGSLRLIVATIAAEGCALPPSAATCVSSQSCSPFLGS